MDVSASICDKFHEFPVHAGNLFVVHKQADMPVVIENGTQIQHEQKKPARSKTR